MNHATKNLWVRSVLKFAANCCCCFCFRGYPEAKISNNLECEIFQTILDEAQEAFPEEKVMELPSDRSDEQTANLHKLLTWIAEWHQSHLPH